MSTEAIICFRKAYFFLSNFYPIQISFPEPGWVTTFPSSECAYQAHKGDSLSAQYRNKVITSYRRLFSTCDPNDAKKYGYMNKTFIRKVLLKQGVPAEELEWIDHLCLRSDWDIYRLFAMEKILRRKFSNPYLAEGLLKTGDAELIEGNWWGDQFWGRSLDRHSWTLGEGENHLGLILMKLRSEMMREVFVGDMTDPYELLLAS